MSAHRPCRITTVAQLVSRMRPGITRSYSRGGPTFDVGGEICDPAIVGQALSDGFVRPLDPDVRSRFSLKRRTYEELS